MNVRELYDYLNKIISPSHSCVWDNDGLMCCPDPGREVRRVLIALDATGEVIAEAVEGGFDLIVTHHPLIFKPVKAVVAGRDGGGRLVDLIRAGVSVMSFHTRLDALDGGVNDILADMLGLEDSTPFGEEGGRIGDCVPLCTLEEFAKRVKIALGAPGVFISSGGRLVSRVAVIGGNGSDDVDAAAAAGADTVVSGELKYHQMSEAGELRMNLIEAGHFYTEDPVCDRLAELIEEADGEIETIYMRSCRTKLI